MYMFSEDKGWLNFEIKFPVIVCVDIRSRRKKFSKRKLCDPGLSPANGRGGGRVGAIVGRRLKTMLHRCNWLTLSLSPCENTYYHLLHEYETAATMLYPHST